MAGAPTTIGRLLSTWIASNTPVPGTASALQFAGTTRLTPVNDFAAASNFASLTFNAGAGAFTLSGNSITLDAAIPVVNSSTNLQTINNHIVLAANATLNAGTTGITIGGVIGGSAVGRTVALSAVTGVVTLSGLNTFTGDFSTAGGKVRVSTIGNTGVAGGLGAGTNINFGSGTGTGTLIYTGAGETTNRPIRASTSGTGGAVIDQSGAGLLKFTAYAALGANSHNLTLQGSTAGTREIGAVIPNNSATNLTSVTKAGAGTWSLSGANTYPGATLISGGTLQLGSGGTTGSLATGSVILSRIMNWEIQRNGS